MTAGQRALMWFRRDLRVHDNHALYRALASGATVVPCFIIDDRIGEGAGSGGARFAILLESLAELRAALRAAGSDIVVRRGDPEAEVLALAHATGASALYFNEDHAPRARDADERIAREAERAGISAHPTFDQLLTPPGGVMTQAGRPHTTYAPFARACEQRLEALPPRAFASSKHLASLARREALPGCGDIPRIGDLGLRAPVGRPTGGEAAARDALSSFVRDGGGIERYPHARDVMGVAGTARVSHALNLGMLSARSCYLAARRAAARSDAARQGAAKWIDELLWREFYAHLLWHFPHVADGAFQRAYDGLAWCDDDEGFTRWQQGETGYPIVDAAMRELRDTAWMHNRSRMIVAAFLTKDLLVDWRRGERHFMHLLGDGDLASNNGGWQWSASTGADAAPYFRIFNPVLQSRKFDPRGVYIRRHVPELARLPDRWIHEPWRAPGAVLADAGVSPKTYPAPIVDHAEARLRALAVYAAIKRR